MVGIAHILQGDAAKLPLANSSIDLVITSPPYWGLRDYVDSGRSVPGQLGSETTPTQFVSALADCTREWIRVLKPRGSIFVNLGDRYNAYNGNRGEGTLQGNGPRQNVATGRGLDVRNIRNKSLIGTPWRYALTCIDDLGLILRGEIIWAKTNPMPESIRDRVHRTHETWFHFTKSDRYYHNREALRPGGRQAPSSVWSIPTERLLVPPQIGARHHAVFPREFSRRIIDGWAPKDATVLDPFGGTGTTALVAKVLGRTGISIDLSFDYCRIANWRVNNKTQLNSTARKIGIDVMCGGTS